MNSDAARFWNLLRSFHIYVAMFAAPPLVFFAFTGFLLNNGSWLGRDGVVEETVEATVPADILSASDPRAFAEWARRKFGIGGTVSIETEGGGTRAVFRRPGERSDAALDRASGKATVQRERRGGIAGRLTDLHKGAAAGRTWKFLTDTTASILLFTVVSGFVLLVRLPRRRAMGLLAFLAGLLAWGSVLVLLIC